MMLDIHSSSFANSPHSTSLLASGTLEIPNIAAGKSAEVPLPKCLSNAKSDGNVFLTVTLRLRESTSWAEAGHEIAWLQHQISKVEAARLTPSLGQLTSKLDVQKSQAAVHVSGRNFKFTFDTSQGFLKSWTANHATLLEAHPSTGAAIAPSFWRPPTDNDVPNSLPYWQRFGVDALTSQLRSIDITSSTDAVEITTTTFIAAPVLSWGWNTTTKYSISSTGALSINVSLSPTGPAPTHVPRAGLNLGVPRDLQHVRWFGLGPGESYPDKRSAQRVGVWSVSSIADLHTHYDVPQEGGNRMGTRWVSMASSTHSGAPGIRVVAADAKEWSDPSLREFNFAALAHDDIAVGKARHPCDLVEEPATVLRLDARVAGVGTGACGPAVREDLMVKTEELRFGFVLEPMGS